jgi:TRAP-type C4-dicarboxylate transport system permease small subunit
MVRDVLARVDKAIHAIGQTMGNIGIAVLVAMMLLTVADVFLRYVFNRPIMGME